jgi:hypothetical protein
MKKDYVAYTVVGVVMGLVLGFLVANWTQQGPSQAVAGPKDEAASVNSSNSPQLPPGHPDISAGQGGQAKQLPAGHPDTGAAGGEAGSATAQPAAASASTELPSLDPLPAGVKEERAEQKYKNVQVLTGVPADRWMNIMFAFKASLGVDCTFCHVKDQWDKDDKQTKQIARKMIKMTRDINSQYVGGIGRVSCFTCHRGQQKPPS